MNHAPICLMLFASACVPNLGKVWDGTWEVQSHLASDSCDAPTDEAALPWTTLDIEMSRSGSQVLLTACDASGCPEYSTAILQLQEYDENHLYSETLAHAVLAAGDCQVVYYTIALDRTGDSATAFSQTLDAFFPPSSEDCAEVAERQIGATCDRTEALELAR